MKVSPFLRFVKKYPFEIGAISFGVLSMLAGGILLLQPPEEKPAQLLIQETEAKAMKEPDIQETHKVEVAGAVVNPGVYDIQPDDRIEDVIRKAGGFTEYAARGAIAQELNKAAYVADTGKIYIPTQYEYTTGTHPFYISQDSHGIVFTGFEDASTPVSSQESTSDTTVIDVNTASTSELDALPGIGPKTAEKIMEARPFSSLDEMVDEKILSQSLADTLSSSLSFSQ